MGFQTLKVKLFYKLLFFVLVHILLCPLLAQVTFPARGFSSILDDFQAEQKLSSFRKLFFTSPDQYIHHQSYLYQFELSHFPRHGQTVTHLGTISGPHPDSPVMRLDLFSDLSPIIPSISFLLIRNRSQSEVWKFQKTNSKAIRVAPRDWLLPLMDVVNHTPFDLLMPFVNWPFEYQKSGRVCGRPAHLFLFRPSNKQTFFNSHKYKVRLAIDDTYNAPLRIEHLDGGILPNRTFSLQSFKKIEDQWVVKAIDAKDRDSQSRTRYEIKAVAHNLDLAPFLFQPSGLNHPISKSSITFTSL